MKKKFLTYACCMMAAGLIFCSCSSNSDNEKKAAPKAAAATTGALPNYRYVDIDSVLAKYNLSKDYQEELLRLQGNLESEARRHENSIKQFAGSMESKYKNNQYTQQSLESDQTRMQQMQASAQQSLGRMQESNAKAALDAEKVIQDSIQNFIKEYNATRHYDAILYKAATLYIDPRLDITDEVVEGLNARYNKVSAAKPAKKDADKDKAKK